MTSYYCTEKGGWVGSGHYFYHSHRGHHSCCPVVRYCCLSNMAAAEIFRHNFSGQRKWFAGIPAPLLIDFLYFQFIASVHTKLEKCTVISILLQCRKNCEWPHYYFQLLPGIFETCPLYPEKKFRYHSITIVQQLFYAVVGVVVYLMSLSNIWFCRSLPQP